MQVKKRDMQQEGVQGASRAGKKMSHDIFISYRREGGEHLAGRIKDALKIRGYSVFMDVEDLKGGKFDTALLRKVEEATDVIVILTLGCLDRCNNDGDWLRQEIRHAIECGKNIVPVMARNFQMPPAGTLPIDIAEVVTYHALTPTPEFFEASMVKLASFLKSPRSTRWRLWFRAAMDFVQNQRCSISSGKSFGGGKLDVEVSAGEDKAKLDENVQFTVYRPQAVAPKEWYPLLAFAHLCRRRADASPNEPDPIAEVQRQARQILGTKLDDYLHVTNDSWEGIPAVGEITFLPEVVGVVFNPPRATFRWLESVHRQDFRFIVKGDHHGQTLSGSLTVFLGTRIVADVPLAFLVDATAKPFQSANPMEAVSSRPYRKVFASYSHRDSKIVAQVEKRVKASGLGDQYLRDSTTLRSGELWDERLAELIGEADIFQLFWSHNSMRSQLVRKEWEHALSLNRAHFIRPVYWEQPLPEDKQHGLPPQALSRIHFQCLNPSARPIRRRSPLKSAVIGTPLVVLAVIGLMILLNPKPSNVLGDDFTNTIGMKLRAIPAGTFLMGSSAAKGGKYYDETQHTVTLTKGFWMGTTHVTRGEFAAFIKDTAKDGPYQTDAEKEGFAIEFDGKGFGEVPGGSWRNPGFDQTDDHPVVEVSWNDAVAFCDWLSKKEGKHYRLPTEAEWEYAARAGSQTVYPWGNNPDDGQGWANCYDHTASQRFPNPNWTPFTWTDGYVFTSPVGTFKPNAFGLYDTNGNALEWCNDWYSKYSSGDAIDPKGPEQQDYHVLRGGSWNYDEDGCRSAHRAKDAPTGRNNNIGFRVVLDYK